MSACVYVRVCIYNNARAVDVLLFLGWLAASYRGSLLVMIPFFLCSASFFFLFVLPTDAGSV